MTQSGKQLLDEQTKRINVLTGSFTVKVRLSLIDVSVNVMFTKKLRNKSVGRHRWLKVRN